MPAVGDKWFPETPEGHIEAREYARKTGGIMKEGTGAHVYQAILAREMRGLEDPGFNKTASVDGGALAKLSSAEQQVMQAAFFGELAELEKTALWRRALVGAGVGALGSAISGGNPITGGAVGAGVGVGSKYIPRTFWKDLLRGGQPAGGLKLTKGLKQAIKKTKGKGTKAAVPGQPAPGQPVPGQPVPGQPAPSPLPVRPSRGIP